ncbi:MAG: DUF5620 domain-containing protein [Ruminococcus sp.]|nr:DUF5620 domain-containing protein [Ruminococcus sp.]
MFNANSKNGFKALAIGCAAVLICASAQMFANTYNHVYAETLSVTTELEENSDGTDVLKIYLDTTDSSTVTLTMSGGTPGATTSGEVGYWDNSAQEWVGAFDSWEEQKFDSNGNLTISGIKVPTNTDNVQIMLTYYADWSSGSENLLDKSSLSISVSDSSSSSSSSSSTTTTASTSGTTLDTTYEIQNNTDGTDTYIIHLDTTGLSTSTVTVTFTGGTSGATTSGEVGYYDSTAGEWVGKYDTWEEQKFNDNGTVSISVEVPTGVEDVQIMLTYYADWSSGSENLLDKSSLTATVTTTGTVDNSSNNDNDTTYEMPENAECGWTDITAGSTGATQSSNLISSSTGTDTKTVTINQGGQWSSYDEGNEAIILDQTWEPEVEGQYDTDRGNDTITNSNNFMFAEDFGMPSDADINHFRFTFESEEPMYQVQIGAGISVQDECEMANSGSLDVVNGTVKKIWFNESGTYDPTDENDYAELENSNGKKYYGFNSGKDIGEDATGFNYLELQWDPYEDVKPYIKNDDWSSVSVQYWYGVDPRDWDSIDWEDPDHPTEITKQPETIYVTEASCNYNLTRTYDYTDTVEQDVNIECFNDMQGIKFSDLGLGEDDKPKSVTFTVTGDSDLGKLTGAFGVSVNDDYKDTNNLESANWYQSSNLIYEDCGSTYEITWVIPEDIVDFISPEYDAEIKFGAWYAGSGENVLDSVTITNISVDYYTEEETTTTTVTTTTTTTTTTSDTTTTTSVSTTPTDTTTTVTTTGDGTEPLWGDVNVDGDVKSNDLLLLKKYLLGLDAEVSAQGLINADVSHDDDVKSNDLLLLKKYLLGLVDSLAPES